MPNTNVAYVELNQIGSFCIIAIDESTTLDEYHLALEEQAVWQANTEAATMPSRPAVFVLNAMYEVYKYDKENEYEWFRREVGRYPLHFSVKKLLDAGKLPNDWKALISEWPHVSVNDPARVAYTRSPEHGEADRQTVTSLGKYLRRHFNIPDHEIRDACAQASGGRVHITHEMSRMIWAVQTGPGSCMQDDGWDDDDHPYNVYDPRYGWGLAYRAEVDADGEEHCVARALIYENGDRKCFVRSYRKKAGYSHADEALEATLREMGYEHRGSWPEGARLARLTTRYDDLVLPYLDGHIQTVADHGAYLTIDDEGRWQGTNTDGTAAGGGAAICEHCEGDIEDEDDVHHVGRDEETTVCTGCRDYHYSWCTGRGGRGYYLDDDETVETVDGEKFDADYLDDNDIVQLSDGEYAREKDCIKASDDEWYLLDDLDSYDIVELARPYTDRYGDTYEYAPLNDTVTLHNGEFIHDDDQDDVHEYNGEFWLEADLNDDQRAELGLPVSPVEPDGQIKLYIPTPTGEIEPVGKFLHV